jgi:hypothetical protein
VLSWLAALEQNSISVWVRESPSLWGFPFILYLHTLGLALLAGLSVGIDLWVLAARTWPRAVAMVGLHRVMWLGFGINALSGVALLLAYPAKALTNWVFFVKLLLIALAMVTLEQLRREAFTPTREEPLGVSARARRLAAWSLCLWAGTMLAGRLLAYTHTILLASEGF